MAAGENDDNDLHDVRAVLRGLQRIGDRLPPAEAAGKSRDEAATALANSAPREEASRPSDRSGERALSRTGISSGDEESPMAKPPVQGRRLAALALAMLAAGTVLVLAGDLFLKYWPAFQSGRPEPAASGGDAAPVVVTERAGATISAPTWPIETGQPVQPAGANEERTESSPVATAPPNPDIISAQQLMSSGRITAAREILVRRDLAASQEGAWLLARSYDPNYLATVQSPDASADKRQAEEWYRRWRDIAARNGMVMDDQRLKRIINSMR
jgi:hypothetical protein